MGVVIGWVLLSLVGEIIAYSLARKAHRNRMRAASRYKLMAWSIEVDSLITVLTMGLMLLAGVATMPYAVFGVLLAYEELVREWIVRPLIIAALTTVVIRLLTMYGCLKVIEEEEYIDE